jgi:hypothetical protein
VSQHYEKPERDCSNCTGYTFPNGCANFCDLFDHEDEDVDLDPSESKGESVCDNCLSATTGHCPGQLDCEKWHSWIGHSRKPISEDQFEPRTIGFHILDPDTH